MADVFISYSKSRQTETADLAAGLEESAGFNGAVGQGHHAGRAVPRLITAELAIARAAIAVSDARVHQINWVIDKPRRRQATRRADPCSFGRPGPQRHPLAPTGCTSSPWKHRAAISPRWQR